MPQWTQAEKGFQTGANLVPTGENATLVSAAPFLRFTDTDPGEEDWRILVNTDQWKLQWLSSAAPDVWADVLSFSDPAAATRILTIVNYALALTNLSDAQGILSATVGSEANPRFRIDSNGKLEWGPGGVTAPDTALQRTAAGVLSTSMLRVTGTPTLANDVATKQYVDVITGTTIAFRGTITGQSIPSATETALNFSNGTIDFNVGGVWSSTSPTRMTAPQAGKYLVYGGVQWAAATSGTTYILVRVNGTIRFAANTKGSMAASQTLPVSDIVHLNAGDYVEIVVQHGSAGAVSVGSTGNKHTFGGMIKVAA